MRSNNLAVVGLAGFLSGALSVLAQPPPELRSAASFAILAGSAVTNSGNTTVAGNVGVSPGSAINLPDNAVTLGGIFRDDPIARAAQRDNVAAYNDLESRACIAALPGQQRFLPGVYCLPAQTLLSGVVTLDAADNPDAVWIFRTAGTLATDSDSSVRVINGGREANVFWQVGGSVTVGARTTFVGNILALASITLNAGARLSGRALAQMGGVTLESNNVSLCLCHLISLTPLTLPNGTVCTPYSQTVMAGGGTGSYTFSPSALGNGLVLSRAGVISGVPATTGSFRFLITTTDSNGCSGFREYAIEVGCPPLDLSPKTLPDATACAAYCQTITVTGGCGTGPWVFSAGTLPDGLTLSPDGQLCGTPTTPDDSTITITARDAATGCVVSRIYRLSVKCAVAISPATLPNGTACQPYKQILTASCGTGPYCFTGTPPAGLSLLCDGTLAGTPTTVGPFTFLVTATDARGCSATKSYTLIVTCQIAISPPGPALAAGTVGVAYSASFTACGGTPPYCFTAPLAALPPGLTPSCQGLLSGTPTATGTFTFPVTATDFAGCSSTQTYTIVIGLCSLTISPGALPSATPNVPYSETVVASGGTGPYSYIVSAGALPSGLTLNSSTGLISGTPTVGGIFLVTIKATDVNGCTGSRTYTIPVVVGGATLNGWGMVALSVLLAGVGFVAVRRSGT